MKQSHFLIASACVVGIAIGYVVGGKSASSATGESTKEQSAFPRQMKSDSRETQSRGGSGDDLLDGFLKGRPAQGLPDSELVKILLQLTKYDSSEDPVSAARRNHQLQLLLSKLPSSRLEQVAAALAADPEGKNSNGINKIVGAMASKDPQRAFSWAKTQKNPADLMESVLGTMAKDDPLKAADLYREGLLDGTFSQMNGWQASHGIGLGMARLGKKALLEFVDSLPLRQQSNLLSNCFRELPENDRLEVMDEMYQRAKSDRLQEWEFKSVFTSALFRDRAQVEAWLDKIESGKERVSLELTAASRFSSSGESDAAREWMLRAIAQSKGREGELLKEAVGQMTYNNKGDIALFASLLPEGVEFKAEDLQIQASNSAYSGFNGLTELAAAIRDPAEQTKLITTALENFVSNPRDRSAYSRINATDFEILSRQIQALRLTGENATKVAEALAAARSARTKPKE